MVNLLVDHVKMDINVLFDPFVITTKDDGTETMRDYAMPQLVYNEKFGRWMMIFRSGHIGGLVFRDAEEIQGPWSGEKILTDGKDYCPSVIDQTPEGDLVFVTPQLQ